MMRFSVMISVSVFLLGASGTWGDYKIPFGTNASTTDSVRTVYGVQVQANQSSKAASFVKDSILTLDATKIASDSGSLAGYVGYTADVGIIIPIKPDHRAYDLTGLTGITFAFRNTDLIPDYLQISLVSDVYSCAAQAAGFTFEAGMTGKVTLAAGTDWKPVALSLRDFEPPKYWDGSGVPLPPIDSVLKYLKGIRISPRPLYSSNGFMMDGSSCTKCASPTMTRQTLEISNLVFNRNGNGVTPSPSVPGIPFDYNMTTSDSAETARMYGIKTFSNTASMTDVLLQDGAVVFSSKLASDSGASGRVGYSAETGVSLPYRYDQLPVDLTGLTTIDFEFRNLAVITDYLAVRFASSAYPDSLAREGLVYEGVFSGNTNLAVGTTWKQASLSLADFATPKWWTDIPKNYPTLDVVLKNFISLQLLPKTTYSDSGLDAKGRACGKCTNPTMKTQTLEIRRVRLGGPDIFPKPNICPELGHTSVQRSQSIAQFRASYGNGLLQVQRLPGYTTVEVVSASGHRVAVLGANETHSSLSLGRGTWYVVARGTGLKPVVRTLAVVR